jgi:Zn-finger nucleic acid-binding protein
MVESANPTAANQGHGLACPVCKIDLVMSERQGIEIDYCPKCRGVWLDRGELDKIIERSANDPARGSSGRPASQPAEPYPPQDYYEGGHGSGHGGHRRGHGRRHGSFLERLFD